MSKQQYTSIRASSTNAHKTTNTSKHAHTHTKHPSTKHKRGVSATLYCTLNSAELGCTLSTR